MGQESLASGDSSAWAAFLKKNSLLVTSESSSYLQFGQTIAQKLAKEPVRKVKKGIDSAEELFRDIDAVAHSGWLKAFTESVAESGDDPQISSLNSLLQDPKVRREIESGIYTDILPYLEDDLEAQIYFLSALSIEQQYAHSIGLYWVDNIPQRALDNNRIGMGREELRHIFRIKSLLQPPVDQAYIKQFIFNDAIEKNPEIILWDIQKAGDEYVYEITWQDGKYERRSFSRMFKDEFAAIVAQLNEIADSTLSLADAGDLPQSYRLLAENALALIPMYSVDEVRSKKIVKSLSNLEKIYEKIFDSDWSAFLSGMHYDPSGKRVEVGLDFYFRTPRSVILDTLFSLPLKEEFVRQAADFSGESQQVRPPVFVHSMISASNHTFYSQGYGEASRSVVNINIAESYASILYQDSRNFFNSPLGRKRYLLVHLLSTFMHEGGHAIAYLSGRDKKLYLSQFGSEGLGDILEEILSDPVGLQPLYESIMMSNHPITPYEYIYSLIVGYYKDLIDSPNYEKLEYKMYGLPARIIIGLLCSANALTVENGKISIIDPVAGMAAIKSHQLKLKNFCNDPDVKPAKVQAFFDQLVSEIPVDGVYAEIIKLFNE